MALVRLNAQTYNLELLSYHGEDVYISGNVEIYRPHLVGVGNHVAIDSGFYSTCSALIGDYIHIAPYVSVTGGENGRFLMGDFCTISTGSHIICGTDGHLGEGLVGPTVPEWARDELNFEPIVFEDFVNIATNVTVVAGVKLAQGTVIGANSFVNKSTEPWTIYVGSPAKPLKARRKDKMSEYAKRLGYDIKVK